MILKQVRYSTLPMNSARTSGSQSNHWATAACQRRFCPHFGHFWHFWTFCPHCRRFWTPCSPTWEFGRGRVWQTDKRRDNLTDRRRGRQRHHSASPTNLDRQQIQVTIHKYRIPDNPQIQDLWQSTNTGSTQTRSEIQNNQTKTIESLS